MRAITSVLTSVAVVLGSAVAAGAATPAAASGLLPATGAGAGTARPQPVAAPRPDPGVIGRTDGYLTAASDRSAEQVARAFLRRHDSALGLTDEDVSDLRVTHSYASGAGIRHLTFDQVVEGVPAYGATVLANVDADGRLINVSGEPVPGLTLDTTSPRLTGRQALHRARADVGAEPRGGFAEIESARLVAYPRVKRAAELAWEVWVDSPDGILHQSVVSATTGEVLESTVRTAFDSAHVWDDHPDKNTPPPVVDLTADPTWLDDSAGKTRLAGNNAHAYADVNADNVAGPGEEAPANGAGNWIHPMQFFADAGCPVWGCTWQSGAPAVNQNAQVTSLFVLTNRFHDHLLTEPIGFDEASRNFERDNSSGAGLGGDRVLAEANDGSGFGNANFATPPDGSPGRMQQYLFNSTGGRVSSSDAADVVFHEYTHGLTNRLVGNGRGLVYLQPRSMGEGWSDFYANDFLVASGVRADGPGVDLRLGEYVVGPTGIRVQPMDCKPSSTEASCRAIGTTGTGGFTFGDLGRSTTPTSVHTNGEIWSQTLWDLRERLGVHDARAVITDGLRLSPLDPTFLQARDAILQAALVRGVPQGAVWEVFAARGMGASATTPGPDATTAVEAFDLPVGLRHAGTSVQDPGGLLGDGDGAIDPGETALVTTRLRQAGADPVSAVSGAASASDPAVLVGDQATWPDFTSPGEEADGTPVSLTVPSTAPCGSTFDVDHTVFTSAGPVAVPRQRIRVGAPQFQTASPELQIPDSYTTGVTTSMTLPAGTVSGMEVSIPSLSHVWIGDLRMTLTSPSGTVVTLLDRVGFGQYGSGASNISGLLIADDAPASIQEFGANTTLSGRWRPKQPLAAFNGQPAGGTWTLRITDTISPDGGVLHQWGLISGFDCGTTAPAAPVVATGDVLDVTGDAATLAGTVDPRGAATAFAFELGTTTAYGSRTTPAPAGAGTGATDRAAAVAGLAPETTYHYRVLGLRDGVVVARGEDRTFTTLSQPCADAQQALQAARDALAEADADVATARQQLSSALATQALVLTQVQSARAAVAKAKRALKKAKRALRKAKASGTAAQIAKATKRVKRAKRVLKRAQTRLRAALVRLTAATSAVTTAQATLAAAVSAQQAAAAALPAVEEEAATQCEASSGV